MTQQTDERFPVTEWDFDELRLRLFRDSDAEDVAKAGPELMAQQYLARLPHPEPVDDALEYIRGPAATAWTSGRAQWAIADAETDRLLGGIGVPPIQRGFKIAEIGYVVVPWARGRGVAARATAEVAEFLFKHDIARAELHVMAGNLPSQHTALRAGFTLDGRVRQAMTTSAGVRTDKWLFGRVPGDPPGPVPRAIPDLPEGGLTDGVVTLRRLCAEDNDAHFAHRNLAEVWQRSVPPVAPDRAFTEQVCSYGAAEQWLHGTAAYMSIRDAQTDAYAGDFGVHVQMGPPGEVMLSYALGRQVRGRGFATRAVRLAAHWAITELGAKRVMAGTAPDNEASQAVLRRAGFTREGVQRALLPGLGDSRVDNVCWALLPEEL